MRVALFGVFGVGNLGNDTSAKAMIALLHAHDPAVEIVAFSRQRAGVDTLGVPVETFTRPSRASRGRVRRIVDKVGDFRRMLRLLAGTDQLVVPGTGLLEEPSRRFPGGDLTWLLSITLAAVVRRVPVAWFAVGGGRSMRAVPRLLTAAALRGTAVASFRDGMTARSLGRQGVGRPVVPDVVFTLAAQGRGPRHAERHASPLVAIAVIDHPGDEKARARYLAELGGAVETWVRSGWIPRFVVGDDADVRDAEAMRAALAERHRDVDIPPVAPLTDFDGLAAALSGADLVVASRYHVLLAAAVAGRPMVALAHAAKDDALMAQLGQSEMVLPTTSFTAAELVERAGGAVDAAERIGADLVVRVHGLARESVEAFRSSGIGTEVLR